MGRFLGSLLARGVVREAIIVGRSSSQSIAPKTYGPDVLTAPQLADCIKRATRLDEDSGHLETVRAALLASKSEIDLSSSAIEFQKYRVDRYSQKSVDAFNALVDRYNRLVMAAKAKQADLNSLIDVHNAGVDGYNSDCAKRYYADDLEEAKRLASTN